MDVVIQFFNETNDNVKHYFVKITNFNSSIKNIIVINISNKHNFDNLKNSSKMFKTQYTVF